MLVTSPGAEYMASQGCFQMPLAIGRHVFPSDLIFLESQGLDVILGMDWLSMYGGNIDCASKTILLTTQKEEGLSMYPGMCQRGIKLIPYQELYRRKYQW